MNRSNEIMQRSRNRKRSPGKQQCSSEAKKSGSNDPGQEKIHWVGNKMSQTWQEKELS